MMRAMQIRAIRWEYENNLEDNKIMETAFIYYKGYRHCYQHDWKGEKLEGADKRPFGTELKILPKNWKQFPNRLTTRRNLRRNR